MNSIFAVVSTDTWFDKVAETEDCEFSSSWFKIPEYNVCLGKWDQTEFSEKVILPISFKNILVLYI